MSKFFAQPAPLDIVYGHFPYSDSPTEPASTPHYCLVLAVFESEASPQEFWVSVAFGTSQGTEDLRSGQFLVRPDKTTGLGKLTKFSLERDKLAKLPYNDEWFNVPPERRMTSDNPKIGVVEDVYSNAIAAAGKAANAYQSMCELESAEKGLLPPNTDK